MDASPGPHDDAGSDQHASAEELAAYALNPTMLEAERREHIVACPVCAPEAAWLATAVTDLERGAQCPSVDSLVQFALGESSSDEQIRIAAHLRDCAACRDEVELTRTTFQTPTQVPDLVTAIHRILAIVPPLPQQLAFGVRRSHDIGADTKGSSSAEYAAGDVRLDLRIEPEDDAFVISGVLRASTAAGQPAGVESVALLYTLDGASASRTSTLVAEATVTSSNDFDLHDIPTGMYRLEVVRGNTIMVLSPITVP